MEGLDSVKRWTGVEVIHRIILYFLPQIVAYSWFKCVWPHRPAKVYKSDPAQKIYHNISVVACILYIPIHDDFVIYEKLVDKDDIQIHLVLSHWCFKSAVTEQFVKSKLTRIVRRTTKERKKLLRPGLHGKNLLSMIDCAQKLTTSRSYKTKQGIQKYHRYTTGRALSVRKKERRRLNTRFDRNTVDKCIFCCDSSGKTFHVTCYSTLPFQNSLITSKDLCCHLCHE